MSIDEQKDLALGDDDAENVVGGTKKKAKKVQKVSNPARSTGHAGPNVNVQFPTNPVEQPAQDPAEYGVDSDT